MKKCIFVALMGVLALFTTAGANVIWDNPDGSASFFDWSSGQSLNGYFGNPELVGGNTFVFSPSNFYAQSLGGLPDTVSDTLEFELTAHQGYSFDGLTISAYGDYFILGSGVVSASGNVNIFNMDTSQAISEGFSTSDLTSSQDTWSAGAQLTIDELGWQHLKVSISTELFAWAQVGSAAFIQEKVFGDEISVQIIPEPATIATLALGIFLLKSRRKKLTLN